MQSKTTTVKKNTTNKNLKVKLQLTKKNKEILKKVSITLGISIPLIIYIIKNYIHNKQKEIRKKEKLDDIKKMMNDTTYYKQYMSKIKTYTNDQDYKKMINTLYKDLY